METGREIPKARPRTIVGTVRARQGVTGHNVRYVLGFGLAGAVAVLTLVYLAYVAAG